MATKKAEGKPTTAQLVARYNEAAKQLGEKLVKRFSNKATAEKRVRQIEARLQPAGLSSAPADPTYKNRVGDTRGFSFALPSSKTQSPPREDSKRAALLGMLEDAGADGIEFQKLHKKCGFKNPKSTRDALGLLSRRNGYGVSADGKLVWLTE